MTAQPAYFNVRLMMRVLAEGTLQRGNGAEALAYFYAYFNPDRPW